LQVASKAKAILLGRLRLSARDAVHLASMQSVEAHRIMSFDADYAEFGGSASEPGGSTHRMLPRLSLRME
jgi:predicted nucleic acid-binding protein